MDTSSVLEVGPLMMGLLGGLALFLFGMEQMTDALKNVAGGSLKNMLARMTNNRFKAALAGTFVTAVIQSSSVTTVLVVGFISAGLMSLSQSIGIIMGANIGTTITAQIIAFKVTYYALVLVAVGFALNFISKRERTQQYGAMIMGLGLIFFGMNLMGDATRPLRTYEPFIQMMQQMENPWFAMLISAAFTGLVQSSSATTGIIIVLATQGFVTLEAGIALAFGANIGTCVTALLASIGKPREAVQASMVHILFNVTGVLIWLPFIDQLALVVRYLSPAAADLQGAARLAAETPRQIANAHTLFNVGNTLLFIWFTTPLARLIRRILPERPVKEGAVIQPRYLDEILLETPALALDRTRMEMRRLGECAHSMVKQALPAALHGTREDLLELAKLDNDVDTLHKAIVSYLSKLARENLEESQTRQLHAYLRAANNIESIGDMIETNVVHNGFERLQHHVSVSPSTEAILTKLHERVSWMVQLSFQALDAHSEDMARQVIDAKSEITDLEETAHQHLNMRVAVDESDRILLFRLESEIIEYLKRVYYHAKRIAKLVAGEYDVPEITTAGNGMALAEPKQNK